MCKIIILLVALFIQSCTVTMNQGFNSSIIASSTSTSHSRSSISFSSSTNYSISSQGPDTNTNKLMNKFDINVGNGHLQSIITTNSGIVTTNDLLIKEDKSLIYACEQTPVYFKGKHYDVVSVHPGDFSTRWTRSNTYVQIYAIDGTNKIVATIGTFTSWTSALVKDDTLFVYSTLGSTNGINRNCQIPWVFYTKDLVNWESNQLFSMQVPYTWNTSVCFDSNRFVIALEINGFNPSFGVSDNGTNFTYLNLQYKPGTYNANPRIRYVNGYYYMIPLIYDGHNFNQIITRSIDLTNWEDSKKGTILIPDEIDKLAGPEVISVGNMEFYEFENRVNFYYVVCDQKSWYNIRRAYFIGTLGEYFSWFFEEDL